MTEKIYRIKRVPNKRTEFLRDEILFKIAMTVAVVGVLVSGAAIGTWLAHHIMITVK
jgi:hypothetical protein